ncbi:MAG: hypothetical protein HY747_07515 [Elusimicrobia bacterium]|nr:hypothetical protein [Elusimicrobiota bacterium]
MIQVDLKCPHCGHSLMDEQNRIDDHPSVRVTAKFGNKKGDLRLSSLYGSYKIDISVPCPKGKVAQLFCPHCRLELKTTRICEICRAPMAAFGFKEGGTIQVCSRRGCKKHLIEFEDPEAELRLFYNKYSTFFKP